MQVGHLRRFVLSSQEDKRLRVNEGRTRDCCDEVERRDSWERRDGQNHRDVAPIRGVINTIAGGFTRGGTTSLSRKRHLQAISSVYSIYMRERRSMPHILFTDVDFRTIDLRHDDPMVVTLEVANFVFMKMLINQ